MYGVQPDNKDAYFQGHGGRLFKIKNIKTGEVIESRNVWFNGEIPKHFRKLLPDNSIFIS